MAEIDYDFEGKTEGDILLSYKAAKGHRTRNFNKITNFLALQEQKYSKFTEASLIAAVKEMERQSSRAAGHRQAGHLPARHRLQPNTGIS